MLIVSNYYKYDMKKMRGRVNLMNEELVFQKLTPTDNVDLNIYDEAFKYIFENNGVKNVAISGA